MILKFNKRYNSLIYSSLIILFVFINEISSKENIIKENIIKIVKPTYLEFDENTFYGLDSIIDYLKHNNLLNDRILFLANKMEISSRFMVLKPYDSSFNADEFYNQFKKSDYCFILPIKNDSIRIVFYNSDLILKDTTIKIKFKFLSFFEKNYQNWMQKIDSQIWGRVKWDTKFPYSVHIIISNKLKIKFSRLTCLWEYNSFIGFDDRNIDNLENKTLIFDLLKELNKLGVFRKMDYHGQ